MVERFNQKSDVLAHIYVNIIGLGKKLLRLINQICRQYPVYQSFLISLIKSLQTVGEQSEGRTHKDAACFAALQLCCNIDHTVAGRNHIINNNDILTFYIASQKLMRNN